MLIEMTCLSTATLSILISLQIKFHLPQQQTSDLCLTRLHWL